MAICSAVLAHILSRFQDCIFRQLVAGATKMVLLASEVTTTTIGLQGRTVSTLTTYSSIAVK